jgi:hypothetical protein
MDKESRWQAKLIDAINNNVENEAIMGQLYQEYADRFQRKMLSSLGFREMKSRYERIAHAHKRTFEWIFDPLPGRQKWSNFAQWLQSDNNLYWITGKPGAGKSTLMKLICDDSRTQHFLKQWAKKEELFILSFYFWNSGEELQMSQEGLVRTILHDALSRLPSLIPKVFATRFESCVLLGDRVALQDSLSWTELLQATRLLMQELKKSTKVVFFIDGLDEFQGNHGELVDFVQGLLEPRVKICVSSRPYNVFEDAFNRRPNLRLEDLTYLDIRHYVGSKLSANLGFAALQQLNTKKAEQLIENVTAKASGVFLWVYLVTQSLLEGLTDGERLSELQQRLDSLPASLEDLFWKILHSLGPRGFERASQLFQIYTEAVKPLTLLNLSYADEDVELVFTMPVARIIDTEMSSRAEIMRRRLNACCKGLLEPQRDKKIPMHRCVVGYLHRTVNDFFKQKDTWSKLLDTTKGRFDLNQHLFASHLARLKSCDPNTLTGEDFWNEVTYCIKFAAGVDTSGGFKLQERSFIELDLAAAELTTKETSDGKTFLKTNGPTKATYWTSSRPESRKCTPFLHLAVQLQLIPYVTATVVELQERTEANGAEILQNMRDHLSSLLAIATLDYKAPFIDDFRSSLCHDKPNIELIRLLLDHGADSNAPFRANKTIWETAIQEHRGWHELLDLFLDHNADLSVSSTVAGALDKRMSQRLRDKKKERRKYWEGWKGLKW